MQDEQQLDCARSEEAGVLARQREPPFPGRATQANFAKRGRGRELTQRLQLKFSSHDWGKLQVVPAVSTGRGGNNSRVFHHTAFRWGRVPAWQSQLPSSPLEGSRRGRLRYGGLAQARMRHALPPAQARLVRPTPVAQRQRGPPCTSLPLQDHCYRRVTTHCVTSITQGRNERTRPDGLPAKDRLQGFSQIAVLEGVSAGH